eukprot:gene29122-biopygen81451
MVAINDYMPGGFIVSHIDPPQLFHRPIITSSFRSGCALSFDCVFTFDGGVPSVTEPAAKGGMRRGDALSIEGYGKDS